VASKGTDKAFQPRLDVLPEAQRLLWEELGETPRGFVLYGGTAIALRLGHRQSEDFDFFSNEPFAPTELRRKLKYLKGAENEHMAALLRRKSKVLVAFGACACEGAIPALANTTTRQAIFDWVYRDSPSTVNPEDIRPREETETPLGTLRLPAFLERVSALDQVVDVDYFVPGCPPQAHQIWAVLETLIDLIAQGRPLPPKGAVLGAGDRTCCDECPRTREEKRIAKFVRPHEVIPDPDKCLLDQGILCMGPATRSGCGARCMAVGMPCRGCYGSAPNSRDQGTKMIAALASVIDSKDPGDIDRILDGVVDPIGTFYRFSLATATLAGVNGSVTTREGKPSPERVAP